MTSSDLSNTLNALTTLTIANEDRQKEINELQENIRKLEGRVKQIEGYLHEND